ncbi:MAG: hypothetical protein IJU25_04440 [Lachnospiraceae bacterium]|nr:hypothetical protein [Lachnospiraceae bacterium]
MFHRENQAIFENGANRMRFTPSKCPDQSGIYGKGGTIAVIGQILVADYKEIVDAHGQLGLDNGDAGVLS